MDIVTKDFVIEADAYTITFLRFEETDGREWKKVFDHWRTLKMALREYGAREPNFPEGLSEVAFCLWAGSVKKIHCLGRHSSFDTLNLRKLRLEQVKACSVEHDLTSFGPSSYWHDLYFLDFWSSGRVDGSFDVYKIPNDLIYDYKVNRTQTFRDQQAEGRRPRFSLKRLISEYSVQPYAENVQVWK